MSVFERVTSKRHREELELPSRATCLRCRREYTRESATVEVDEYCWWCAAAISHTSMAIVTDEPTGA